MFKSANSDLTTAKVAAERELEGLLRERAVLEKGLAEGRAELNHNLLRLQALQGRDQEVRDVVWKVLNFVPDVEEQYYSKVLDHAIKQFYTFATDAENIRTALEAVSEAVSSLSQSTICCEATLMDIYHVIQWRVSIRLIAAFSAWPKLKHVVNEPDFARFTNPPNRYPNFSDVSAHERYIRSEPEFTSGTEAYKSYLTQLQEFLLVEQKSIQAELSKTKGALLHLSEQVSVIRCRLLESRIESLGYRRSAGTDHVFFKLDRKLLDRILNGTDVAVSEKQIGMAVGQVYPNVLNFGEVLPPSYE